MSKPINPQEAEEYCSEMSDAQLMADLEQIEDEVKRRKKAYPLEAYAVWAMNSRFEAFARFNERQSAKRNV